MIDAKDLIKYKVFKVLSTEKRQQLADITQMRTYKKNDYVYENGNAATHLFMVDQGLVGMRKIAPGDRMGISFEVHAKGDLFGAASFMPVKKYTLTAVCLEDCRILAMDAQKLAALCEQDPQMGFTLMKRFARLYFNRYQDASKNLYGVVQTLKAMTDFPSNPMDR